MKKDFLGFNIKHEFKFDILLNEIGVWSKKTVVGEGMMFDNFQPVDEGELSYMRALRDSALFLNLKNNQFSNELLEMCKDIEIIISKLINDIAIKKEEIIFKSVNLRYLTEKVFYSAFLTIYPDSFEEYQNSIKESLRIHAVKNNQTKNPLRWLGTFGITSIYGLIKFIKGRYNIPSIYIKNIIMFFDSMSSMIHNFSDFNIESSRLMSLLYFGRTSILNIISFTARPLLVAFYEDKLQESIDICEENFSKINPGPTLRTNGPIEGYLISGGNKTLINEGVLDLGADRIEIDDSFVTKITVDGVTTEKYIELVVNAFHKRDEGSKK